MGEIVANFNRDKVFILPKDTEIPTGLVLLKEKEDQYSLQTSNECDLTTFHEKIASFVSDKFVQGVKQTYFDKFDHPVWTGIEADEKIRERKRKGRVRQRRKVNGQYV
jgi:hypothetical protein